MKQLIFPSLVAQDQDELNAALNQLKMFKIIHLDVVDGIFAKSHSLDFNFKLSQNFKYQAHLMIKHPEKWIKSNFNKIDFFIPHFEEIKNVENYIGWMKKEKKKVALALLPETKILQIKKYLKKMDLILVLTVQPGFYGSKFLRSELKKIRSIKKINPKIRIFVDGGMNPHTIKSAVKAGADYFVSGSYLIKSAQVKKALQKLEKAIRVVQKV